MREAVGLGLQGIRAYKMRAGLTILGVVMGIMTVTGMSSIVAGLNASMAKQIESLGSSVIFMRPFGPGREPDRRGVPAAQGPHAAPRSRRIAEQARGRGHRAPGARLRRADQVRQREACRTRRSSAPPPAYEIVHDVYVAKGRFISETDVNRAAARWR